MTMGRWLPPFGISFRRRRDGARLRAGRSARDADRARLLRQMEPPDAQGGPGFYALVLLLLAGVDGAFLTGDLFNLYVWFEVMLIASFGLLVSSGTPISLDGAVKYGILNFIAHDRFSSLALGLLYGALGTLNMADIIGAAAKAEPAGDDLRSRRSCSLAFGIKAAAFPVNCWLPASYHTPPAVISALLGGLLTKVGVYALLRTLVMLLPASRDLLQPAYARSWPARRCCWRRSAPWPKPTSAAPSAILLIGGIGAALSSALPCQARLASAARVAYVVNAMLTISALYLVAGLIERVTGRDRHPPDGRPLRRRAAALDLSYAACPDDRRSAAVPRLLAEAAAGSGRRRTFRRRGYRRGRRSPPACCSTRSLTLVAGARLWAQSSGAIPRTASQRGERQPAAGWAGRARRRRRC